MENMIKKIIDADNNAKALEQAAQKEKEELAKQVEIQAKQIYDKYMSDAKKIVLHNNELEEKKAQQQWETIEKKQRSVDIKLQSDFQQGCDRWVDEIVARTLAE